MLPVLTLAAVLGGLPPIAVSLEPADCPTEVQLSRVLAALGAKLVPFGSSARATVYATRSDSGEWSLTLGRPGHSEKRKVTLTGACDEQAAALGAIIERFARPVLVIERRDAIVDAGPVIAVVDAGVVDAGALDDFVMPFDAGAPPEPLPPPPPPPPLEPLDAGAAPPPPDHAYVVGGHIGIGIITGQSGVIFGPMVEFRKGRLALGGTLDYYGPVKLDSDVGVVTAHLVRPQLIGRLQLFRFLWLEGGFGVACIWNNQLDETLRFRLGAMLGVTGAWSFFEPIEFWVRVRSFAFLNLDKELFGWDQVLKFPTFTGELTAGVSVRL